MAFSFYIVLLVTLHYATVSGATSDDLSQIVVSPENLLIFEGQTLLVPCVAYIQNNYSSLGWSKDGVSLESDTRFTTHSPVESDRSGVLFVRVVLEVCNVTGGDAGVYSCVLGVNGVEKDSTDFEMTVSLDDAPTQIIIAPETREVSENKTIILTCVAVALPSPVINWTQNGHLLSSTVSTNTATSIHSEVVVRGASGVRFVRSTLEICNVQGIASGEYKCLAGNGISSSNATFEITRKAPIQLLSGPQSTNAYVGTNVTFTCDFQSTPLPHVNWSGVPLTTGGRFSVHESVIRIQGVEFVRSSLTVYPVAEYDGGEIACIAGNELGELRHGFNLTVIVPPEIIISPSNVHTTFTDQSQTLTFVCVALGTDSLTWNKDGREITTESVITKSLVKGERSFVMSFLEVCDFGAEDSGSYSCVAENGPDKDVATFDVCLVASAGLLVAPSDHTLQLGHTLSVPCVAYTTLISARHTTVSWTRGNVNLVNSSKVTVSESHEERGRVFLIRSILLVSCVDPLDAAQYSCHVTTDSLTRSAEFTVDVQVPPLIKEVPDHTHTIGKGGTVSFTCLAGGVPPPVISWFKGDSMLETDLDKRIQIRQTTVDGFETYFSQAVESVLTITGVTDDNSGVYNCKAVSELGTVELGTPYSLIVDQTVVTGGLDGAVSVGIGHASYIGTIIGFVCFLVVFAVYVAIRPLRMDSSTPPLLNVCLSLMALNISFILSYNTTHTGGGCVFFAALFHYLFLVAMLAMTNLVVLKIRIKKLKLNSLKRELIAYNIAFTLNWGVPLFIVIVSLAPNVSNYHGSENGHFCGPTQLSYWLGELFPFVIIHLPTWFLLFLISYFNKPKMELSNWLRDSIATALTLLLFDIAWGIGLPTTQDASLALQILFLISTTSLGVFVLVFYCLVDPKARVELMKVVKRGQISNTRKATPAKVETSPGTTNVQSQAGLSNPILTRLSSDGDLSLSGIEAAKELTCIDEGVEYTAISHPRGIITSFSESFTEEDLDEKGCDNVPERRGSVMGPRVVNVRVSQHLEDSGVRYAMVDL